MSDAAKPAPRQATKGPARKISARLLATIEARLRDNKRVRRELPGGGRIAIDRQLPFICVYRWPVRGADAGTDRFATSEASYLLCSAKKRLHDQYSDLLQTVARVMVEQFGAFLILELWAGSANKTRGPVSTDEMVPEFKLLAQRRTAEDTVTAAFSTQLGRISMHGNKAKVTARVTTHCSPRKLPPIISSQAAQQIGCHLYGLDIGPIYRDPGTGEVFPLILRLLRRRVTLSLRRALFDFTVNNTPHRPPHFHALGRRAVVKAVWDVDRMLADFAEAFDFLLMVTPLNGEQAWTEFKRKRYQRRPSFHYRPLPAEPLVMKRRLYRAPIERIEDPALAQVFHQKLVELDRQVTMLQDRNTPRFLHGSLQQYGAVQAPLYDQAIEILRSIPPRSRESARGKWLNAAQFAARAHDEAAYFRRQLPGLKISIELRDDVAGLMVSRGRLLISARSQIPSSRVEALIQHEVGTHVLTYHNGRAQRLRHLYTGLAGYDTLQEGLAVFAEYLVGGLSRPRLRLLAGRVVAAWSLVDGASFVECYRQLHDDLGFEQRTAFMITMRTYRGGGLTKDAVYLQGLGHILTYLASGGALEPLFIGKIAASHIPFINELLWRGVVTPPPLTPRYMNDPEAMRRLERAQRGMSVIEFTNRRRRK